MGEAPRTPSAASTSGRRVSFGILPDFSFAGPGVKAAGVTPGSPAEKAGVQAGDVLLKVGGNDVANLQGFSTILRGLAPGQTVKVLLERGGQRRQLDVAVVGR
ncbi:MAG: PDZ domain-containing protein, partial [Betaproteobacteria bacterium]